MKDNSAKILLDYAKSVAHADIKRLLADPDAYERSKKRFDEVVCQAKEAIARSGRTNTLGAQILERWGVK